MATEVYVNQKYLGTVDNPTLFVEDFKDQRRKGQIEIQANIFYNKAVNEIHISSQKGRSLRPLIIVKEGKSLLVEKHIEQLKAGEITWDDLTRQGVIEYLDANEEENALVAFDESQLTTEHSHLEITPGSITGITTALVPFGNYNQSSRLIIGSKNQKQAIGFYIANYFTRMDMDVSILNYPQYPIVGTLMHETLDYDKHPSGQNVVVAVMSYQGYNMEDAIVLNKGSIDRGMARTSGANRMSPEVSNPSEPLAMGAG